MEAYPSCKPQGLVEGGSVAPCREFWVMLVGRSLSEGEREEGREGESSVMVTQEVPHCTS